MKLGDTIFNGNQFKNVILNSTSYKRLILGVNLVWSYFSIAIKSFKTRISADGGTYEGESILEDRLQEITPSLFDSASLVITPNGVKTSKLYSIKPSDGTGDLSVTRATTATRIDENGNIVNVPANMARIDYSNGSAAILVEPQRTNLVPNSQTFVGWTLSNSGGVSISNVNTTNPFGFSSVTKVIPTTTLGQHRPFLSANYSASGRIWVIAKADGYNYLSLGEGGGLNGATIIFNLSNGTISGSWVGYNGEISSLGDGWYKCSLNMNSVGTISRFIIIRNNNTTADYSGDGTSGILIAHKQLEVGSFDTSAIITSGTIATRNADVISKTGLSGITSITETFDNGTTNVISGNPTNYTMSQGRIKQVIGL